MKFTNILLGISGGIAAYKAADLTRRLIEAGYTVRVVMTASAQEFITPLTLQTLSGHPVHTDLFDVETEGEMSHITLARWADLVLIAPCTANTMNKLAIGLADDLLSTICLATTVKIAIAPAMNKEMWGDKRTQESRKKLLSQDTVLIGPGSGEQACGEVGAGRMSEPDEIIEAIESMQGDLPLQGKTVMVTAGATIEPIDPVRYLSNHSSGTMGYAMAHAARDAGARVILVSGKTNLTPPKSVERIDVSTAQEMFDAVHAQIEQTDIFISVAAVSDYRAATPQGQKIKKSDEDNFTLMLTQTPDILKSVGLLPADKRPFTVGFAAETNDVTEHAKAKLTAKNIDMIAANQVGKNQGFGAVENALTLITPTEQIELPNQDKQSLAQALIKEIIERQ